MAKFVKITSTDETGSFSYTGQLIRENSAGALVRTGIADMFFPKGDYTMTNARSPRNFNASIDTVAEVVAAEIKEKPAKAPKAAKVAKAPKEKKVTKIDTAAKLLAEFKAGKADATRQEMIHHLMATVEGMNDKKRASGLYQAAIKRI